MYFFFLLLLVKLKVPRFVSELIREPILEENDIFHRDFQKYALEFIRTTTSRDTLLSGLIADEATDGTLNKIERASVVQATNITFSDQELLLVIYRHLQSKGLLQSANVLAREGKLQPDRASEGWMDPGGAELSYLARTPRKMKTPKKATSLPLTHTTIPKPALSATLAPLDSPIHLNQNALIPTSNLPAASPFKIQPKKSLVHLRFENRVPRESPPLGMTMSSMLQQTSGLLMESDMVKSSNQEASSSTLFQPSLDRRKNVTLDHVITEFLRDQHSHCQNPMSVLPSISILGRHYLKRLALQL